MKFVDQGSMRLMRSRDPRGLVDRLLCWFFHARNFWRGDWFNEMNVPLIKCVKCDWKWTNE